MIVDYSFTSERESFSSFYTTDNFLITLTNHFSLVHCTHDTVGMMTFTIAIINVILPKGYFQMHDF